MTKKYNSFTGITGFYYMPLNTGEVLGAKNQNALNTYKKYKFQRNNLLKKRMGITVLLN